MTDKDVALRLKLEGADANKVVKIFKQELREANGELLKMQTLYGESSKQAQQAADRVASLKDQIKAAGEVADLFDPGNKFMVFGNAIRTVTGGFAGLQGAMALFGNESEELQKTMVKLQGAMALTQGVSTILDSAKDFQRLGAIIKTQVVTAFSTLRGAMMATGIGALVVAVGALVTNFGGLRDKLFELIPGLKTVTDFVGGLVQRFTDFIGVTSESERALESQNKALESSIKRNQEWLDRNGDKFDEYTKRKIQANITYQENLKKLNEDETKSEEQKQKEKAEWAQWLNRQVANADKDRYETAAKAREEDRKKREAEFVKEQEDAKARLAKQLDEELAMRRAMTAKIKEEEVVNFESIKAEEKKKEDERAEMMKQAGERVNATVGAFLEQRAKQYEENSKRELEIQQLKNQIEIEGERAKLANIASILESSAQIAGQQTAAGKALSIAATTISTYQAAQSAYQSQFVPIPTPSSPIRGTIAAIAAVAAGLARVKAIMSVKVPGGSAGGGVPPLPNAGGGVGLPNAAISPTASPTAINQELLDRTGNAAVRAYVLESDNTSSQQVVQRIQRAARLGG